MNSRFFISNIQREIWEHRKIITWLPIGLALFALTGQLISFFELHMGGLVFNFSASGGRDTSQIPDVPGAVLLSRLSLGFVFSPVFILFTAFTQVLYFKSCLFDERRDMSHYFWRSLPVSDATAIGMKLATGALVIPIIFTLVLAMAHMINFIFVCITATAVGLSNDIPFAYVIVENLTKFKHVWLACSLIIASALWLFPVFSILMLASMVAKKSPSTWIVLPLFAIFIIESITGLITMTEGKWFTDLWTNYLTLDLGFVTGMSAQTVLSKVTITGTVIGLCALYLTHWLRVNRSHA